MNETDMKLLWLASKSAGFIEIRFDPDGKPRARKPNGVGMPWNPLDCFRDALLLAIQLGLTVRIDNRNPGRPSTAVSWQKDWMGDTYTCVEFHNEDAAAATRRAITAMASYIAELESSEESDHEH